MNSLLEKARAMFTGARKRARDRPHDQATKPVRQMYSIPALWLTPEEIMAEVARERNDPKHREEIEYYRAKCTEHLGGSR
jgi:hypothetical protein